jgi:acetyl-CoA C-acetyltransferase
MMGETTENLADLHHISREEQDEIAFSSHEKAIYAIKEGYFKNQIVPIHVKTRKGEMIFDTDEGPRENLSKEKLSSLKPAFRDEGTVTAGNSSSLNDGAAAVLLMSEEEAKRRGVTLRKLLVFPFLELIRKSWAEDPSLPLKKG